MGWRVAVVFDAETNLDSVKILIGQMPVWALRTEERQEALEPMGEEFRLFWIPEPAFTLFTASFPDDRVASIVDLVPTIEEHHPKVSGLSVVGVDPSRDLNAGLSQLGYEVIDDSADIYPDRIRFAKPVSQIPDMPEIVLDAGSWQQFSDFYDAFFAAVDAPDWHGRNFNALNDSIGTGGINKREVPNRIIIRNGSKMGEDPASFVKDFEGLVHRLQGEGCPVDLVVEPT